MVPVDGDLYFVGAVFAFSAVSQGALLYWMKQPAKMEAIVKRASSLILGLLSYLPVTVGIVISFAFVCVGTILSYTVRQVGGKPTTKINLKVTFD